MSAASERARALLAIATQGRWLPDEKEPHEVRLAVHDEWAGWCADGPRLVMCDSALLNHDVAQGELDAMLVSQACSPDGGLLATLAGEVEALERGSTGEERAERARLREALVASRRTHGNVDSCYPCPAEYSSGACNCGADEHNARIEAALAKP